MKLRLLLLCCLAPLLLAAAPLPQTTPSGILIDRVIPLAHLKDLAGTAQSPPADLSRWRQTMHELRRAADSELGWPGPRELQNTTLAKSATAVIPLALIHARYDRLDAGGNIGSQRVFALGALRERIYYGAGMHFVLDPRHIFTHETARLGKLTFDPDDDRGPRPLRPDEALPVSYTTTGVKTLKLTAQTDDGRTLTARALLTVMRLDTPSPTETWTITATEPFDGAYATGQAYVYLASDHMTLTNPVIVVEGFDLDNTMDWPVLYDLLNQQNLLEDLRSAGFDAVVLDFSEATEPIERNAYVLTELLSRVNTTVPAGKTSVVIGASMGGLVTRYALAWLEQNDIDHRVRTYISFDSPHGGANIPLGVQHWLRFFKDDSADADFLLSRLDTPAARQMLLYHQSATNGTVAAPAPERATWLADLSGVGDWPRQPRLVAIANGSGVGQDQGFDPGDQLILYEYRSLLVDIDGNVWAVPDGTGPQVIFDGGINLIWPMPDTYETISVTGTTAWDSAPGGFRDSMAQMDATNPSYGDIIALHPDHCFVPTISALAIDSNDPFFWIALNSNLMDHTPFDALYWPIENQEHITITAAGRQWFLDEIAAGITGVGELPAAATVVLYPAVPNPFNPRTEIRFELARAGDVSLAVYDLAGRLIQRLCDHENLRAGTHTAVWNGLDNAGIGQASGLYFACLRTGKEVRTETLTLVR